MNYEGPAFTRQYTVAATPETVDFELGFKPGYAVFLNRTTGAVAHWSEKMNNDEILVAGSPLLTSGGVTVLEAASNGVEGLRLGTATGVNSSAGDELDVIIFRSSRT